MNTTEFGKLRLTLRSQLHGMSLINSEYNIVLDVFNFAEQIHTGVRKDKVTKEFYHQLSILGFLLSLHPMIMSNNTVKNYTVLVYGAAILHDLYEDYPQHREYIREHFPTLYPYVIRLSKIRDGIKLTTAEYYTELSDCPVSSIVKIVDRIHNISTMVRVFCLEKQSAYLAETREYVLPMIKEAKIRFPENRNMYEHLKSVLNLLITVLE